VNRGEVWWVEHPAWGRRPYLVLSRQSAIPLLHSVLTVPATTTIRGIPSELGLDREDGMPRACVLSFDNLVVVPKSYFTNRICRLSIEKMREVCDAVAIATGCA
jgi:mRNA interferase MazF